MKKVFNSLFVLVIILLICTGCQTVDIVDVPTATPVVTEVVTMTEEPTATIEPTSTVEPTEAVTETAFIAPAITTPTVEPTMQPTAEPTVKPTFTSEPITTIAVVQPTVLPTSTPKVVITPTLTPTVAPTPTPTVTPTATPIITPTIKPSATSTVKPTETPTVSPTIAPPTATPQVTPTPEATAKIVVFNSDSIFGTINNIDTTEPVFVTIFNEQYVDTVTAEVDGNYKFTNVPDGDYSVKVDALGYEQTEIRTAVVEKLLSANNDTGVNFTLTEITNCSYYFTWNLVNINTATESSARINKKIVVDFADDEVQVVDIGFATILREKYNLVFTNNSQFWSTETIARFYELYKSLPDGVLEDLKSVWTITNKEQNNDISFYKENNVWYVTLSKSAITNSTPRVATIDGQIGSYYSNRLYNAIVRFVTNNGTNAEKCEKILNQNFLSTFIIEDYSALTAYTTCEDENSFQEFYPEEKLLILTMFEEMPKGMQKMSELKYLVRRKQGTTHPIHPNAAAVTWCLGENSYIEFVDKTFIDDAGYTEAKRLIIHEKAHIFYEYHFSDELKEKWCEIGGWYINLNDIDGWSTTKQTEFVTAYAHSHNPDEDMAESIAYYVLNPDKLRSVAYDKYEFIKNYIMQGSLYITQFREDLTFEVYNLNLDYVFPGQIKRIEIIVFGEPTEDKQVNIEIELVDGDMLTVTNYACLRLLPSDKECPELYDMYLYPTAENSNILCGSIIISKYSYNGYWFTDQIGLYDTVGNARYESNSDFDFKLYIDNPLYDNISPQLDPGTLELSLEAANLIEHPDAQYLVVKFKFIENQEVCHSMIRLQCLANAKESIDIHTYDIDNINKTIIVKILIPEYYSSGMYEISEIVLVDLAGNTTYEHVCYGGLVNENNKIEITTTNPDDVGPVLDVNNIIVTAKPTIPDMPNGETSVTVSVRVSDNISGVKVRYIRFRDPQGNDHGYWMCFPSTWSEYFVSENPTEVALYTFTFILPKGSAPGVWGILEITLTDCALSTTVYSFTETMHFDI